MSGSMEIELLNQPESDRQPFEFKARDKLEMAAFRESCKNLTIAYWGVNYCKMTGERCETDLVGCQLWQTWKAFRGM